jgi:hypothetical protein
VNALRSPAQGGAVGTEPMLEHENGAIASIPELAVEEGSLAGAQPVAHRTRMMRRPSPAGP